ncbi:restriction endonuclease subunit S [Cohnella suwonensis]|uniref:Restriction endonuclease subunit S n=1 Tax=Cohnella suwonensis TaxID=696072 RepID=A0ABW0LWR1_9BACL
MSRWERVRLGDVCDFINGDRGKNYPTADEFIVEGIPFINAGHISNNAIDFSDMNYISEEKYNKLGSGKLINNDIVYCLRGSLGKHAIVSINSGAIASSLVIIRPNTAIISSKYLTYCMDSIQFIEQQKKANNGSSQPNLSAKSVKLFEVPLPLLDEQNHITDALDIAAKLLSLRKEQLAELDNLIKSTFHEMFGDPVRNEKEWLVEKLKGITTKIGSGATPKGGKESYHNEGICLIRSMNVHNGVFKYDQLAHLDDEQATQLDNVIVKANDILINITGASVARSCIVPTDVLPARVNQHVSIVRVKEEKGTSEYINKLFTTDSFQNFLLAIGGAGGATREAITKHQLQELDIPLPPLPLQNQFAEIVAKIEEQKVFVKKAIDETQQLFDSLMSEYFDE